MMFLILSFLLTCSILHLFAYKDDFLKANKQDLAIWGGVIYDNDWGVWLR